jgi:hypothetical protein
VDKEEQTGTTARTHGRTHGRTHRVDNLVQRQPHRVALLLALLLALPLLALLLPFQQLLGRRQHVQPLPLERRRVQHQPLVRPAAGEHV